MKQQIIFYTIIKKINFDNIEINTNNIFTVNEKQDSERKQENNYLYTKYCESFNDLFDKKFLNKNNNMSATQNKIKNNYKLYNSKQSGSTKDSNRQNSSTKKHKVISCLENKFDKK